MSDIKTVANEFKDKLIKEYELIKNGTIDIEPLELLDNILYEFEEVENYLEYYTGR